MVERFWPKPDMDVAPDGPFVRYSDYEALERQNAELRRRNEELEREITGLRNSYWEERKAHLAAERRLAERDAELARKDAALLGIAESIRGGLTENSLPDHRIKIGEGNHIDGEWLLGPGAAMIRNMLVAIRDLAEQAALSGSGDGWRDMCATDGCGHKATVHFERGGIGSYYCHDCYMRIQALPASPSTAGER